MLTTIKIYFRLLINQSVSKTTETTNRMIFTETKILVHFYKKIPAHHHHFPWLSTTLAVFHDFPGLENGLTKFHDFPGRVLTLIITINTRSLKSELKPGCLVWVHNSLQTNTHSQLLTLELLLNYVCITQCQTLLSYSDIYHQPARLYVFTMLTTTSQLNSLRCRRNTRLSHCKATMRHPLVIW